jgi:Zn-dependent protease
MAIPSSFKINEQYTDNWEPVHSIVRKFMSIQSITTGKTDQPWILCYRGEFFSDDTEKIYADLENKVAFFNLIPQFRLEDQKPVIYLLEKPKPQQVSKSYKNLILFIITFISVWVTGALYTYQDPDTIFSILFLQHMFLDGWPFAVSLLTILGAHEMGHYFAGRWHKVNVSLPYFLPLPIISPFGTMGAFINMKSAPKNRKQLFDIGAAGPLSGLIVAIPILFIGLSLSHVEALPMQVPANSGLQMEGNSLFYLLAKYIVFQQWLPQPVDFGNLSPFLYWVKYFFTGKPFPYGGLDVIIHPVAWAAWGGILVTSLNLIPSGQLDGGHILYALLGEKSRRFYPIILVLLVILGFFWSGWWFWATLIFFINRAPAPLYDQLTPLDNKRKVLGVCLLILFVLLFSPIPLVQITG